MKYCIGRILLTAFLLSLFCSQAFAGAYDFVVVQPGQPGSTEEAQPVMDELAKYVSTQVDDSVSGKYFNELSPALEWIGDNHPAWGIMGLPFYEAYRKNLSLKPIASTLPSGSEFDLWRIIVPTDGPDSPEQIEGAVYGSMFYTTESAKLLFSPAEVPNGFEVKGTSKALRYLRRVARGRVAGVCLNRIQFSVARELSTFSKIKVIHESRELRNSPVVIFEKNGPAGDEIAQVLLNMKNDPQAAELLKLLRTEGFGPADGRLE